VADVQLDDFEAGPLQIFGATRERPTDLVANLTHVPAGTNRAQHDFSARSLMRAPVTASSIRAGVGVVGARVGCAAGRTRVGPAARAANVLHPLEDALTVGLHSITRRCSDAGTARAVTGQGPELRGRGLAAV